MVPSSRNHVELEGVHKIYWYLVSRLYTGRNVIKQVCNICISYMRKDTQNKDSYFWYVEMILSIYLMVWFINDQSWIFKSRFHCRYRESLEDHLARSFSATGDSRYRLGSGIAFTFLFLKMFTFHTVFEFYYCFYCYDDITITLGTIIWDLT